MLSFISSAILALSNLEILNAFQQSSAVYYGRLLPSNNDSCQPRCLRLDVVANDDAAPAETKIWSPMEWDEQFEELVKFQEEHGHSHFPLKPTSDLKKKYPNLEVFCRNQREDYKEMQKLKSQRSGPMRSLPIFDRNIRLRRLDEMGFALRYRDALWYDRYHNELVVFYKENGNCNIRERQNPLLFKWIFNQRRKHNDLNDEQIALLDAIDFPWEPDFHGNKWNAMYNELKEYHSKHGHYRGLWREKSLWNWGHTQRSRREGRKIYAALTNHQINLLDEIEFQWKPDIFDVRWNERYQDLVRFQKDHGHCRPTQSTHRSIYGWSRRQRGKRKQDLLTKDQIELLDKIGFCWDSPAPQWSHQFKKLVNYYDTHGHLRVDRNNEPNLYEWASIQRQRYNKTIGPRITGSQIERLEQVHFCWSSGARERAWHEKYTEVAEYWKEQGHVRVAKKDNPSLHNWINSQGKRYQELKGHKPLSSQELEMLEQIDFEFLENQPRMAWNAMYATLLKYQKENDGKFPIKHQDDPDMNRWMRQQRNRMRSAYGYVPLTDEQRELLNGIDFPWFPEGRERLWFEKYDEVVEFQKQNGHFLVDREEDPQLHAWIDTQRKAFRGTFTNNPSLSPAKVYLMERIAFSWSSERDEVEWQQRYEELVQYKKEHGHLRIGRTSAYVSLYYWKVNQLERYKGTIGFTKLSDNQRKQLEAIDGFC